MDGKCHIICNYSVDTRTLVTLNAIMSKVSGLRICRAIGNILMLLEHTANAYILSNSYHFPTYVKRPLCQYYITIPFLMYYTKSHGIVTQTIIRVGFTNLVQQAVHRGWQ